MGKLPLTEAEKEKPYSKYYYMEMEGLDPLMNQIISKGCIPVNDALPISRLREFYEKGYQDTEFGYCMMPDGSGYISVYNYLPHVSKEMIGWWWQWIKTRSNGLPESSGNLRYRVWFPEDHWDVGFLNGKNGEDGSFLYESLDWGAGSPRLYSESHVIDPELFSISQETQKAFADAGGYFDISAENSENYASRILATYTMPCRSGGVELRGKIYQGWGLFNGKISRDYDKPQCTEEKLRNNLIHTAAEIRHLDYILPMIYAERGHLPLNQDD